MCIETLNQCETDRENNQTEEEWHCEICKKTSDNCICEDEE